MVYLDHNATSPMRREVLDVFIRACSEGFGNPSSIHAPGRAARRLVEDARDEVAALLNCDASEVVFTSGGTEANNAALKGVVLSSALTGGSVVTTTVEHPSVLNPCAWLEHLGRPVVKVPVDAAGMPDPRAVAAALSPSTVLVSMMFANNETGNIFPVEEVAAAAAERKIPFHCDAVQAAGRIAIDFRESGISLLSLSAHKMGGPKGIGALVVRKGTRLHPLLHGGAQERNRRGGTENVPAIAGFGEACRILRGSLADESARVLALRQELERRILGAVPDAVVIGHERRLPNTVTFGFPGVAADSLLMALDMKGIHASSGSACSSGAVRTSHVLGAMGVAPGIAAGSLRISFGHDSTAEDVDAVAAVLPAAVSALRRD